MKNLYIALLFSLTAMAPACGGGGAGSATGNSSTNATQASGGAANPLGLPASDLSLSSSSVSLSSARSFSSSTNSSAGATITTGYSPATNYSNNYCADNNFPAQWEWRPDSVQTGAQPATSGTPLIKQIRNGVVIATYNKFSGYRSEPNNTDGHDNSVGPFRRMPYLQWVEGDVFEVFPAVYEGDDQQIYIGSNVLNDAAYSAGTWVKPKNITIRGITVNGVRPVIKNPSTGASSNNYGQALVYVAESENVTIENIDIVDSASGGQVGKAGIYLNGAKNLTLKNVRVAGFKQHGQNGIFGTYANSGTFLMQNVELADNGGDGGPEHNIYMNASGIDSNFTVKMVGSWSHGSYYGHLFKSRAQINILEGNYFEGSRSTGNVQAEAYLVDIPEGGTLVARNNIFTKTYSGDFSNGASLTFSVESGPSGWKEFDTNRPWALTVEHNTFVAFSKYFDSQSHILFPFFFNSVAPVPAGAYKVANNAYVGYCPTGGTWPASYYGTGIATLNFNQIDQAFRPRIPVIATGSSIIGTTGYNHKSGSASRATAAIGARD